MIRHLEQCIRQPQSTSDQAELRLESDAHLAQVVTVHKSQGSEFTHACLVLPDTHVPVLTRELIYTGLTRAKAQLTWLVPNAEVMLQAVATPVSRSGGLGAAI